MRVLLIVFAVWVSCGNVTAQEREWLTVTDQQTVVSVEMPGLPKLNKQDVLVDGLIVQKDIYSFGADLLEMYFEITPIPESVYSNRTISRQQRLAIDNLSFKYGGRVQKKEKLSREGIKYQYYELSLSNGEIVRSVVFAERGKLFHIYAKGNISEVFGIDANYYLLNWNVGTQVTVDEIEVGKPDSVSGSKSWVDAEESYIDFSVPDGWVSLAVDKNLVVHFPTIPFKKTTMVEFGTRQLIVEAWSRHSESNRLNYVVTRRVYGPDEGQLSDVELSEYMLEKLISLRKLKWINEKKIIRPGLECREYILSKGLRFYRMQYIRIGDTIYQVLVKGGRKNIHKSEAEQFFGAIRPLN